MYLFNIKTHCLCVCKRMKNKMKEKGLNRIIQLQGGRAGKR